MKKLSAKKQDSVEPKNLGSLLSDEQKLHIIGGYDNLEIMEDNLKINISCKKRWADCKKICVPIS